MGLFNKILNERATFCETDFFKLLKLFLKDVNDG